MSDVSRTIKCTIAYDGTDFAGYQAQRAGIRTVQGEMEKALAKIHKHVVAISGAGRTDSGVHATGQVVSFCTDIASIPAHKFVPALNGLLPRDVRVLDAAEVAADFHARFSAKMRCYRYFLITGRSALPHEDRYVWCLWRRPDTKRLNEYAALLHGEMDCSLFASPADSALHTGSCSPCRFIESAEWKYEHDDGGYLVFTIAANAFLWKMVRCIVGSLLYYEEKGIDVETFRALLNEGNHAKAGPVAPAKGLFLTAVEY